MKLTLGFSPCPNDTYIFDALVNNELDTGGLEFEVFMEDVQTLNEWAIEGRLDISKISYAALPLVMENYQMLHSGGALGSGVGPLLVSKIELPQPAIRHCTIAVPGQNTTANLLFSLAFPEATNKLFLRYDLIEEFVQNSAGNLENLQAVKLGVIIHENRFTYAEKNLIKLADLGEMWENQTGYPIPLGGIVIRRSMEADMQRKIDELIRMSIHSAKNKNKDQLSKFITENAQEMNEATMRDHINLYVNKYSENLGEKGKEAVNKFLQIHTSMNKLALDFNNIFI